MTTDTYAYAPAVQPALTWSALCDRNPSLRSSAAERGRSGCPSPILVAPMGGRFPLPSGVMLARR